MGRKGLMRGSEVLLLDGTTVTFLEASENALGQRFAKIIRPNGMLDMVLLADLARRYRAILNEMQIAQISDNGFVEFEQSFPSRVRPGDLLWVAEPWYTCSEFADHKPLLIPSERIRYVAEVERGPIQNRRAATHMPQRASRFTLVVDERKGKKVRASLA